MKSKKYSKSFLGLLYILFLALILPTVSYAELTVESYCQLAIEISQPQINYLNDLTVLTRTYCEDSNFLQDFCNEPNIFLEQKLILQEQLDSNSAALFADFNTTAEEYAAFAEQNASEIDEYLYNEPNIELDIYNLSDQIEKLQRNLKVPSYCLLAIAVIELEKENLAELKILAQEYVDDPNVFYEQEQIKRQEFEAENQALFESFDSTAQKYLTFMGKNAIAVETYLHDHPELKQVIDGLSNEVNILLEEYEALREGIIEVTDKELPK